MSNSKEWDFTKVPKEVHGAIIALYDNADWLTLMKIHNELKLSRPDYCCSEIAMKTKWGDAIKSGKISIEE